METTLISKIRGFLWPIYGDEHKRFLPTGAMIALILANYSLARNIKDTLVVTASGSSEIIPFLKVWGTVPGAFIFFILFAALSARYSKEKVFYIIVSTFTVFFGLFALVIYPNKDLLHPTVAADQLSAFLPAGLQGLVAMFRYWSFSLFYVMAELWGSACLSLLFWQFANDYTRISEAKRFYPHFYLVANAVGVFGAGFIGAYLSRLGLASASLDPWGTSLNYLMAIFVVNGLLIMVIYTGLNKIVLPKLDKSLMGSSKKKKAKAKLTMKDSALLLFRNPYLGLIAMLVICYGVVINLVEVVWKNQIRLQYPTPNEYNAFMGNYTMAIAASTVVAILVGGAILRSLGWRFSALVTPAIIAISSVFFFFCVLFPESASPLAGILGATPLLLAVLVGAVQNVLSKSFKYALFDSTKEMSYIPLDSVEKSQGKAAVDVVAARLGKSGGALTFQFLFIVVGPIAVIMPYAMAMIFIVTGFWIFSVIALAKRFRAKCADAGHEVI